MVPDSVHPDLNQTLDQLLAATASTIVLVIAPIGELAAYRGPADQTTAHAIIQLLNGFTELSEPAIIHRILLDAGVGGDLYLAPLPQGWKLILIDQAEATSTRISEITPFIRLATADIGQVLHETLANHGLAV